ncbi:MAG: hypothetical protein NT169_19250 [Chloroflexi bacterium]|nr:hypothetical protein [Chloroflexota bacterium]
MNPADILDDCLQRLQFGETVESCLTHYPDQAADLRPLLAAAVQVRGLAGYHLSNGQRLRAKVTLRETLAARSARRSWLSWGTVFARTRGVAFATILAAALFVALTVNGVAASQPGDLAYRLRVVVERAPAVLQTTPERRATAELDVAERRLTDLDRHLTAAGRSDETALAALLAGDAAAAEHASAVAETGQRDRVADRVVAHAATLTRLSQVAVNPAAAAALITAAEREYAIAGRLRQGLPPGRPADRPTPPRATPTPSPAISPTVTLTGTPTATPTATQTPQAGTATPSPDDRPRPTLPPEATRPGEGLPPELRPTGTLTPGWRATAIVETATTQPLPPRPTEGTRLPRPTGTLTPGWRATAIIETVTARPPMTLPPPIATRLTQSPEATSPVPLPGRRGIRTPQPTSDEPAVTPEAGPSAGSTPAPAVEPLPSIQRSPTRP